MSASQELTNAIYEGLDVSREICAVHAQKLGDTIWLWDEAGLAGFSVCETLSVLQGMSRLVARVNTSRHEAYRRMIGGFRTLIYGGGNAKAE